LLQRTAVLITIVKGFIVLASADKKEIPSNGDLFETLKIGV